jgi:hypothetical protein
MVGEAILMRRTVRQQLEHATPRGAPDSLRERVLSAVQRELAGSSGSRWDKLCGWSAAAALLVGVLAYQWTAALDEDRSARLFGPVPTPQAALELRKTLESETDPDTARWLLHHYALDRRPRRATNPRAAIVTGLSSFAGYPHEH